MPVFATADEITVYPFRDSVSTEDRIFRHDSTRSPEHRIVQPEGLSKTGLEVDHLLQGVKSDAVDVGKELLDLGVQLVLLVRVAGDIVKEKRQRISGLLTRKFNNNTHISRAQWPLALELCSLQSKIQMF